MIKIIYQINGNGNSFIECDVDGTMLDVHFDGDRAASPCPFLPRDLSTLLLGWTLRNKYWTVTREVNDPEGRDVLRFQHVACDTTVAILRSDLFPV